MFCSRILCSKYCSKQGEGSNTIYGHRCGSEFAICRRYITLQCVRYIFSRLAKYLKHTPQARIYAGGVGGGGGVGRGPPDPQFWDQIFSACRESAVRCRQNLACTPPPPPPLHKSWIRTCTCLSQLGKFHLLTDVVWPANIIEGQTLAPFLPISFLSPYFLVNRVVVRNMWDNCSKQFQPL